MGEEGLRLAVLGGGPIGAGVAAVALLRGASVRLWSRREETRRRARSLIEHVLASRARRETLPRPPQALLERLQVATSLPQAVGDAPWVLEAVVEDLTVKHTVLAEAEGAMPPDALLSTTASWPPVSALAGVLGRPHRFLNTHFYNPPWGRRVVEVVPGPRTAPETLGRAEGLLRALGREPAPLLRDHPGFAGNRCLFRQLEEALRRVARGTPPEVVDASYRFRLGFPVGPCEAVDYIGLDVLERLLGVACAWGWDPPPEARALLQEKMGRGEVGPASGRGLYPYPSRRWEGQALEPHQAEGADAVALIAPAVLEAARLVQEGVARPEAVEAVATGGIGWPRGPLALGRSLGVEALGRALAGLYREDPSPRYRDEGSLGAVLA